MEIIKDVLKDYKNLINRILKATQSCWANTQGFGEPTVIFKD